MAPRAPKSARRCLAKAQAFPQTASARSPMIVCSCNVLSDHEIWNVVTASREQPPSAQQVYDCLGCSVQCGRCARGVKRIITEASVYFELRGVATYAVRNAGCHPGVRR
jgi:bacterioferritin-associated ferredoxin